jgi:MFS family permease
MRRLDRVRQLIDEYPRQLWLLFGGMLISATGGGMVWPFLTIYVRQQLEIPLTTVALLLTLNAVAGMVATSLAGPLVDRLGRKGVMFVSLSASCLVYLAMTQADSFAHWTVLIILLGASGPPFRVGSNAMVADLVESEGRANAYALLRVGNNLGIAIGPMIGGFVAAVSYSWAFLIAAIAYAIFALLLLLTVRETLPQAESASAEASGDVGYGLLLRDRRFLAFCLISALAVVPASIIMVLLPVYAKEQYGVIESQYGFIMATNAAMVVFFQYSVTQVTKRYPHLPVLAVGTLLYGLGVGSVALGRGFVAFLVSMIVTTVGELIMVPTGTALAANLSPLDMRGRYMGVYGLTWSLAFGVGPVIGGLLNDNLAPVAIWYGALVVGLLATGGFVLLAQQLRGSTSGEVIAGNP